MDMKNYIESRSLQSVEIIGHRGSAAPYPENTLQAILYGILSGAKTIEVDLRLSKDKEVILFHNENLSRMTGINQNVSDKTWLELSQLPIRKKGKLFYIPRLIDILKIVPRDTQFYLELKAISSSCGSVQNNILVEKVISIIKKERMKKRCLIMSFNKDLIQYLKKKYPSYSAGIIVSSSASLNAILKGTKIKYNCIALNQKLIKKSNLQEIKDSGIPFIAWTVNTKRLWKKILSYRPFGIVTDYPDKFSGHSVYFNSK